MVLLTPCLYYPRTYWADPERQIRLSPALLSTPFSQSLAPPFGTERERDAYRTGTVHVHSRPALLAHTWNQMKIYIYIYICPTVVWPCAQTNETVQCMRLHTAPVQQAFPMRDNTEDGIPLHYVQLNRNILAQKQYVNIQHNLFDGAKPS